MYIMAFQRERRSEECQWVSHVVARRLYPQGYTMFRVYHKARFIWNYIRPSRHPVQTFAPPPYKGLV